MKRQFLQTRQGSPSTLCGSGMPPILPETSWRCQQDFSDAARAAAVTRGTVNDRLVPHVAETDDCDYLRHDVFLFNHIRVPLRRTASVHMPRPSARRSIRKQPAGRPAQVQRFGHGIHVAVAGQSSGMGRRRQFLTSGPEGGTRGWAEIGVAHFIVFVFAPRNAVGQREKPDSAMRSPSGTGAASPVDSPAFRA